MTAVDGSKVGTRGTGGRIRDALRAVPAALRWNVRERGTTLPLYYFPLWSPYVFGSAALAEATPPYARMVAAGFLLLCMNLLVGAADHFADVEEDRAAHPERTREFLASRDGSAVLTAAIVGAALATAISLGAPAVGWLLGVAIAFALLMLVEKRVGRLVDRLLTSSVFGLVPLFVAEAVGFKLGATDAALSFALLTSAQLSMSLFNDVGDRVNDGRLAEADRWIGLCSATFAASVLAGIALLWLRGGAWAVVLGGVALAAALPFASSCWSRDRHARAATQRIEPWIALQWTGGSAWRLPVWTDGLGFPQHIFAILALDALLRGPT
jgi:4-hydroxybenzoate polyprenyltransferase